MNIGTVEGAGRPGEVEAMEDRVWTAEDVRAELPSVPVKINGEMCIGRVRGRKLPFAQVHTGWGPVEAAWATLAYVLSGPGRFLRA